MGKVTCKLGDKNYSFNTNIQLTNLVEAETLLHEEIKSIIRELKSTGETSVYPHDLEIKDDNGLVAFAESFENIGNLKIKSK